MTEWGHMHHIAEHTADHLVVSAGCTVQSAYAREPSNAPSGTKLQATVVSQITLQEMLAAICDLFQPLKMIRMLYVSATY